ncbi:uracil-DNA glycosylase family protein [Haladaptatus cibarius]|uniref:uracil-DNA glycosylase family protein n=1 Tax=Haladaptatus cibarius TaxID=453847 RepID=UPI0006790138|nr:uracil-DNA glycosylase family protein [Haladaptatus cibarius]
MQNVTDRISNPFGMRPPCQHECVPGGTCAVFGYGDANADFHLVGDHPGVHGGNETNVPFTGTEVGEKLQPVLNDVGLLGDAYGDEPAIRNLFMSYLHMCCLPGGREPTPAEYGDMERFFDAELRAIAAHILLPVGEKATQHVFWEFTAQAGKYGFDGGTPDMTALHAEEIKGRGFLVVPVRDPREWEDGDAEKLEARLDTILAGDYQQTVDLGRFMPDDDPYEVR